MPWSIFVSLIGILLSQAGSLPRCFVLDTNGTIVLKTDNGIELKQSLETLGVIPKDEK